MKSGLSAPWSKTVWPGIFEPNRRTSADDSVSLSANNMEVAKKITVNLISMSVANDEELLSKCNNDLDNWDEAEAGRGEN